MWEESAKETVYEESWQLIAQLLQGVALGPIHHPVRSAEELAPATSLKPAAEIVEVGCLAAEEFRWYPVGKTVENVRNQEAELLSLSVRLASRAAYSFELVLVDRLELRLGDQTQALNFFSWLPAASASW